MRRWRIRVPCHFKSRHGGVRGLQKGLAALLRQPAGIEVPATGNAKQQTTIRQDQAIGQGHLRQAQCGKRVALFEVALRIEPVEGMADIGKHLALRACHQYCRAEETPGHAGNPDTDCRQGAETQNHRNGHRVDDELAGYRRHGGHPVHA